MGTAGVYITLNNQVKSIRCVFVIRVNTNLMLVEEH